MKLYMLFSVVLLTIVIALGLFNWKVNPDFLIMPAYNVFNILIAILFSFIFIQKRNYEQKIKDYIESQADKMLFELKTLNNNLIKNEFDYKEALSTKKMLSNKIQRLKSIAPKAKIEGYVNLIDVNFRKYEELIDEYLYKGEEYVNHKIRMNSFIDTINSQIEEIRLFFLK